jgi:hypothetical protein
LASRDPAEPLQQPFWMPCHGGRRRANRP